MKIGIITPNNLWFCPYVHIYTSVLDKNNVDYDIITWCRDGKEEEGCIQYKNQNKISNPVSKLLSYFSFASFVKKTVLKNKYDKLIVFTPQVGIFVSSFLKKKYKGKYIFDYRDLSIEQNVFFKRPFLRLLNNSAVNVISSPGFKQYLPKGDYIISHNFDIDAVLNVLNNDDYNANMSSENIDVLTIGGIRDYESNVLIIDALVNKEGFTIHFVGRGPSVEPLKSHAIELGATNVFFEGFYPKEKEKDYVSKSTFLNIFYPRKPSHDTALSNRFYNSLIYRKPMITTADTTQGDYAVKYGVGIAVANCDCLTEELGNFFNKIDRETYSKQCNILLKQFVDDYNYFLCMLKSFIECSSN